ncbi:Crotonobetainyl-CoA:carnitine CoA-transferase CaiB [Ferrimonas sediminum]|uniref:Crotonobetainyl-CoA:carnitine CoA-transferase CaiB n=1 Tax=Ferrimonas sediminum TaxID=718193 RepID=A0A1G8ZUP5_9GAMM|nr:CaiB/BaiF CoA-transferase family protein [Ferrimonas sediminum]SDK18852.1 Crotonobetainyl-CoA:carnitine CoA-transferase CaiB [Ferrimonas sediminum]
MKGPLSGIRVLDFSTLLPGPYATMMLADMGAQVTRIESPTRPDLLRSVPPMVAGRSAAHLTVNRNKHSVALDLKSPEAIEAVLAMVGQYDVVVEQFRPGVMTRLGLGYEQLKAINPQLIYCSITGYGQHGPMQARAGHDINYLALSGLASYSGRRETGPVLSGTQVADLAGGSQQAVVAILAALLGRGVDGEGQHLDVAMADGALAMNALYGAGALASGEDPEPGQEMLNGGGFYDYYRTADDRYFAVGGLEPQFAEVFFTALGQPQWLARAAEPCGQQQALKQEIGACFAEHSFEHWRQVFAELDCCCEPVLTPTEAAAHPQFQARNMLMPVAVDGHELLQVAMPVTFRQSQGLPQAGAVLGQHTREVLLEAGLSAEAVQALLASGAALQSD